MTYKEFTAKIKRLGLTRQVFANETGLKYMSVLDWSRNTKTIPTWIGSWLNMYEKAKKYDEIIERLK
jgi:hypothetical protein